MAALEFALEPPRAKSKMVDAIRADAYSDIGLGPIGTAQGLSLQTFNHFGYHCKKTTIVSGTEVIRSLPENSCSDK